MPELNLETANRDLAVFSPEERIQWAYDLFGKSLVLTTSFGTYSAVMLHLAKMAAPEVPMISIDTGWTVETRAFARDLLARIGVEVRTFAVPQPDPGMEAEAAEDFLRRGKTETLESALTELGAKVWMSGVQGGETDLRKTFEYVMRREDGLYKLHPILDWNSRTLYEYCQKHDLPTNDLYFDPLKGEDQKKECGIHQTGISAP